MQTKTSKPIQRLEYLSVSEFAKLVGVHPITLKRWSDNGTFLPAKANSKGHKFYTQEQAEKAYKLKVKNTDRLKKKKK